MTLADPRARARSRTDAPHPSASLAPYRVGTLGPDTTCCANAVLGGLIPRLRAQGLRAECVLFDTMDLAREALRSGAIQRLAVPDVHQMFRKLKFSPTFVVSDLDVFTWPNPPMYVAAGPSFVPGEPRYDVAAVLEAWDFLDGFALEWKPELNPQWKPSNPAAAQACSLGQTPICVTNEPARARYQLSILATLKHVELSFYSAFTTDQYRAEDQTRAHPQEYAKRIRG